MPRALLSLPLLSLSLLTGCPAEEDTADPAAAVDLDSLTRPLGCGDVVMHYASDAGDLMLVFEHFDGLAEQAYTTGAPAAVTLDLAVEGSLALWAGANLVNLVCNDYTIGDEVIETTWTATAGTATLEVVSNGTAKDWGEYYGDGTLTLTDVTLESPDADPVTIDSLTWTAYVGWMPG